MDAIHYASIEYNTHNLFGYGEANATALALEKIRNKRAMGNFVLYYLLLYNFIYFIPSYWQIDFPWSWLSRGSLARR